MTHGVALPKRHESYALACAKSRNVRPHGTGLMLGISGQAFVNSVQCTLPRH